MLASVTAICPLEAMTGTKISLKTLMNDESLDPFIKTILFDRDTGDVKALLHDPYIKPLLVDVAEFVNGLQADPTKEVSLVDGTWVNQALMVLTVKRLRYLITLNPDCIVYLYNLAHGNATDLDEVNVYPHAKLHKFVDDKQHMTPEVAAIVRCSLGGYGSDLHLKNPLPA